MTKLASTAFLLCALGTAAACGGADPSSLMGSASRGADPASSTSNAGDDAGTTNGAAGDVGDGGGAIGSGSGSGGGNGGSGVTGDAGAPAPIATDAGGADAAPPPPAPDVFTGAPAFAPSVDGATHHAGQDCMGGCHNHGFTFAGTLTDGLGNPVAGAEVRLVDANGAAISVHTGPTGNFHSSTAFTGPAHVGARDATTKALMAGTLTPAIGGCNGCHATGGAQTPIHLP